MPDAPDDPIRLLADLPLAALQPLLDHSLAEGHAMVARLRDEWLDGGNRFDRPGEALYGAYRGGALAGVCGRNIDPYRDDPGLARVRHLYVLPAHRRAGLGRALVERMVRDSPAQFRAIALRTRDPGAARFYRALGFAAVDEPTATHVMALRSD